MKKQIQIAIAEDHDVVREGLVSLLREQKGIKVIFDVSNGQELLEKLKVITPHIILLDLEMPIMSGKEALEKIKRLYPNIKIVVLSAFFQDEYIIEYVKKGVHGYLPKNYKIEKVVDTIYQVQEKGMYFGDHVSTVIAKELAASLLHGEVAEIELSEKEKTIIRLICQDKTNEEIGDHLTLSKKTIDYHRAKIMRKTGSNNATALITYAIQHKIISIQ